MSGGTIECLRHRTRAPTARLSAAVLRVGVVRDAQENVRERGLGLHRRLRAAQRAAAGDERVQHVRPLISQQYSNVLPKKPSFTDWRGAIHSPHAFALALRTSSTRTAIKLLLHQLALHAAISRHVEQVRVRQCALGGNRYVESIRVPNQ